MDIGTWNDKSKRPKFDTTQSTVTIILYYLLQITYLTGDNESWFQIHGSWFMNHGSEEVA